MEFTTLPFEYEGRYADHYKSLGFDLDQAAVLEERDRQLEDFLALLKSSIPQPDEWTLIWSAQAYDLTFDGTHWWTVDGVQTVTKRTTTGAAVASFTVGSTVLRGVTFDGTDLWLSGEITPNEVIRRYSRAGDLLTSISTGPDTDGNYGIAWDGSHNWLAAQAAEFAAERWSTAGAVASSFGMGSNNMRGMAFYGGRLYVIDGTTATIRVYQVNGAIAETISGIPAGATGLWIDGDGTIFVSAGGGVYRRGAVTDAGVALSDLTDVDVASTSPTNRQALVYDDASGLWVPGTVSAPGRAWTAYTPAWTTTPPGTTSVGTGGTLAGAYELLGKTLNFRINLKLGSSPEVGGNAWLFGLPANLAGIGARQVLSAWLFDDSTSMRYRGVGRVDSLDTVVRVNGSDNTAETGASGTPFAWAEKDELIIGGQIEVQ